MARFEILYHASCDLGCTSAEEAAAILNARMRASGEDQMQVHQLAVWHDVAGAADSPLDTAARFQLDLFFQHVHRCTQEAEERFRGDVEAILLAMPAQEAAHSETDDERGSPCTK